jgi:predicted GNAT family acetyltransferase
MLREAQSLVKEARARPRQAEPRRCRNLGAVPVATVVRRPDLGRYEILYGDQVVGFIAYEVHGSSTAFMHTEIVPEYAGRGLGRQLVRGALDDVASHHGNVLPYCSFVRSLIARDQAYLHLVPHGSRRTFGLPSDDGSQRRLS